MATTNYSEEEQQILHNLGQILREHRLRCKLTQERVAENTDTNVTYISDIERGRGNLSVLKLVRFAKAYGVPLKDIFENYEG